MNDKKGCYDINKSHFNNFSGALILLFILSFAELSAQQVAVQLQSPPPYQIRVEDMWNLVIINPGSQRQIYLHGTATETSTGLIIDVTTSVFTLPQGTKRIRSGDVGSVTVNQKNNDFQSVINRLSALPNGSYEICVEVIEAVNNSVIGSSCINHDVLNISQITLLYPEDRTNMNSFFNFDEDDKQDTLNSKTAQIKTKTNSQIVFTWLPPVPVTQNKIIRYRIKMVELFGMQSAYDAMNSNPLFFSADGILTTSYLYPLEARDFNSMFSYAWAVEAYIDGHLLATSEIFEFSFTETTGYKTKSEFPSQTIDNEFYNLPGGLALQNSYHQKEEMILHNNYFLSASTGLLSGNPVNSSSLQPVSFVFNGELFSEVSNRFPKGSGKKPSFTYASIAPSVYLYGIPFTLTALISSENSADRQNMNSFAFSYDVNTAKQMINTRIETEGAENVPGVIRFFSDFNSLGIGTNYPSYSPLTLQGVPVAGLSFEYNPGWFYIASAFQKNQKPINNTAFRRDLYSGRIGVGKVNDSHLFFTGVYTNDNAGSIIVDTTNQTLTPNSNYVFGIDGKLNLFGDKLTIESEIAAAMLTRDNRDANLVNEDIPELARRIFEPKISSQIDYAYSVKTVFDNRESNTKVSGGVKMIGPGYRTLGNPTLRNDRFEIDGRVDQRLIERQVSFSLFVKYFHDNLINSKLTTTSTVSPGAILGFRFKKLPYLNLSYTPSFMSNDASDPLKKIDFKNHLFTTTTGYNFKIGTVMLGSNLFYMFNKAVSLDTASGYTSNSFTLSENLAFRFPLIISASFGMSFLDFISDYGKITSVDGSVSYTFFDYWSNTIGTAYAVESGKNNKVYFYFVTAFTVSQQITIDLRAELNNYKDKINKANNFEEFILRSTAKISF